MSVLVGQKASADRPVRQKLDALWLAVLDHAVEWPPIKEGELNLIGQAMTSHTGYGCQDIMMMATKA